MSNETPQFKIRRADTNDVNFIFSSWLKSFRDAPMVRGVPNNLYYANHHEVIQSILQKPLCVCFIACDESDPSTIFGYAVVEYVANIAVLHFLYTKHALRGFGLASKLIETAVTGNIVGVSYSHYTRAVDRHFEKITKLGWVYNPYLITASNKE